MQNSLLLLGELSEKDLEWFQQVGERICIPAGEVLIREGEPIERLYILLEGRLVVTVRAPGIPEYLRTVAHLTVGEIIGEMSFTDHRPPSATVTAEEDAVLLAVPQDQLSQYARDDVEFGRRFYRGLAYCLSNRLRVMNVSLPQAGIEISGSLPPDFRNPEVIAHMDVAKTRLTDLIGAFH